jgi:predicted aspartyl protease
MKMGETHVIVKVHGPLGSVDVEMLADTGSTLTKIDESTARGLGIVPTGSALVELADGTDRERGIAEAKVEIMGDSTTVRILIGPDGEEPLLGLTTLESLRLKVNLIKRRLEPAKFIEYSSSLLTRSTG